ncbi:uncharacterized protein LOC107076968 [Arapaima gigas]
MQNPGNDSRHSLVFFDLETTGLDILSCDIVQMSAVCGDVSFNMHMLPRCRMSAEASRVTGFTVQDDTLFLHGQPVDTVPRQQALVAFVDFVCSFRKPVLVAHNALRFDAPVLIRALREFALQSKLEHILDGFLDTFLLSKELHKGVRKYSQEYLVLLFLKKTYKAHNALEDVKALQELFYHWNPRPSIYRRHIFSIKQLYNFLSTL